MEGTLTSAASNGKHLILFCFVHRFDHFLNYRGKRDSVRRHLLGTRIMSSSYDHGVKRRKREVSFVALR